MTNAKLEWTHHRRGCRRALMPRTALVLCGLLASVFLLAGCASTKVDVLWSNPEFAARKIEGKVLVVGLTRDQTMRRVYEDELVAQFAARGFGAKVLVVRSYEFVDGAFAADGTKTLLAARGRLRFCQALWWATNT